MGSGEMGRWGEITYNLTMIDVTLTCYHCKSENIVRNGITRNGKQRYKCYDCERTSRDLPQPAGYSTDEQERILRAYEERSSLRGLERIFGISRKTVTIWLKKKVGASSFKRDSDQADEHNETRVRA